jgi:hypothetical protein
MMRITGTSVSAVAIIVMGCISMIIFFSNIKSKTVPTVKTPLFERFAVFLTNSCGYWEIKWGNICVLSNAGEGKTPFDTPDGWLGGKCNSVWHAKKSKKNLRS